MTLCVILFANGCARVPKQPLIPMAPAATPRVSAEAFYHTVRHGETLYRISKAYHVDLDDLMRVNGIQDPSNLETDRRLLIPGLHPLPLIPSDGLGMNLGEIRSLVGPPNVSSVWQTITLHHSGTPNGSARLFHRNHLRRRMGGLFYHFVIGNGTSTRDGALEVGWRWKKQVRANRPFDIQICVVGDFTRERMSEAQFQSLVNLVRILREEYRISLNAVRRHEDVKGKRTECPGKNFPFHRLLAKLAELYA